jgi:hypothetical protein
MYNFFNFILLNCGCHSTEDKSEPKIMVIILILLVAWICYATRYSNRDRNL